MNTRLLLKDIKEAVDSGETHMVANLIWRYSHKSPYYFIDGYWQDSPEETFKDYLVSIEEAESFENDDELFFTFLGKDELIKAYEEGEETSNEFVVTDYRRFEEEDISEEITLLTKDRADSISRKLLDRELTIHEWDKFADEMYDEVSRFKPELEAMLCNYIRNYINKKN